MNAIGSSQPSAAVIATPNTAYSRFKGAFSLCCAGPSMSTDGVMDKSPHEEGDEEGDGGHRRVSTEVDMGDVYK